jgi:uncharacterized protein YecA (UPF0149 family)
MFSKDDADCPFWRGKCREHKCRLYVQVIGKHPQTAADVSEHACAFQWLPMLLIENAKEQRHTTASVDKFNNEMVTANGIASIQQQIVETMRGPLIESK